MTSFTLPPLPGELNWKNPPLDWRIEPGGALAVTAGPKTDWFIDPAGTLAVGSAPVAQFAVSDDPFILSAHVKVGFASAYDAGVLHLFERNDLWAKLCFEFSPGGRPMVVSVVTRGTSDDCNSATIDGDEVYLRVFRSGPTFAFHYSLDGWLWSLVRYFTLGRLDALRVGLSAQSPTGEQCAVVFSEVGYRRETIKDIRSGE